MKIPILIILRSIWMRFLRDIYTYGQSKGLFVSKIACKKDSKGVFFLTSLHYVCISHIIQRISHKTFKFCIWDCYNI
ncbi:hypothetical protein X975_25033, partial [Stegodyphus mimosarum]